MAHKRAIQVGDRVKLTSKFLRSTGQYTGSEAQSVWTVTGLCHDGRWAITDEPAYSADAGYYSAEELAEDPTLRFRRIAVGNLQCVTRPDVD
jgi:hypothetical protein